MRIMIAKAAVLLPASGPTPPALHVARARRPAVDVAVRLAGCEWHDGGHPKAHVDLWWQIIRGQCGRPALDHRRGRAPTGITLTYVGSTSNGDFVTRGDMPRVRRRSGDDPPPKGFGDPARRTETLATYQRVR
jgi:hypothetical protein